MSSPESVLCEVSITIEGICVLRAGFPGIQKGEMICIETEISWLGNKLVSLTTADSPASTSKKSAYRQELYKLMTFS